MSEISFRSILAEGTARYEEKKSVFLGFSRPLKTEEAAVAFIEEIKRKYPDARHHVYAYALREGNKFRYSDDGEPAGTAGMPVLDAIRKPELTDCGIVVVRYFGGTLLGTGGLVHAYSCTAAEALQNGHIVTFDAYCRITVTCQYPDYQKLLPLLQNYEVTDSNFTDCVMLEVRVPKSLYASFEQSVIGATAARANIGLLKEALEFSEFYMNHKK